jgi:hypothetical protein
MLVPTQAWQQQEPQKRTVKLTQYFFALVIVNDSQLSRCCLDNKQRFAQHSNRARSKKFRHFRDTPKARESLVQYHTSRPVLISRLLSRHQFGVEEQGGTEFSTALWCSRNGFGRQVMFCTYVVRPAPSGMNLSLLDEA